MTTPSRTPIANASSPNLTPSRPSMEQARSPPSRTPSLRISNMPSAAAQHRQSFNEMRGAPPSPRSQRQPSLTQLAVQELIDNPPQRSAPDPKFAGRDWRTVKLSELTSPEDLKFVDVDTGVEAATSLLVESGAPVLLMREGLKPTVVGTFDYRDLNAYLLLVVGLAHPDEGHVREFVELARHAREGKFIPLREVKDLGRKEPLTFLSGGANLIKAIETFGKGVHRVLVTDESTKEVIGLLSQSRLVKFLWENGRSFPVIDQLYAQYLRDLKIGSNNVVSINGDKPLTDALTLLLNEGVSSLAVLDNSTNVIGNISVADVRLLTKSSSLPLLGNTCIHFISVILSTRGMYEGKDSFPVFHVTPLSTLAHTVAKLVATRSHRMWVTEPVSPVSSGPPTPSLGSATLVPTSSHSSSFSSGSGQHYISPPTAASADPMSVADALPKTPFITPTGPSISASSLPGARISGRLVGVVSLTDILILFARAGGLHVADPVELRMRRRRSSSSSVRQSVELGVRPRPSAELTRKPSGTGSDVV